jgi:hypothetical protein
MAGTFSVPEGIFEPVRVIYNIGRVFTDPADTAERYVRPGLDLC